jgi:hypothetical protein
VSDVPFTSHDLNETIAQAGVSDYLQTTFPQPSTRIPVNRTGRYLRVQLSTASPQNLSLAEVQVLAPDLDF